jgi:hypothetical protein
VIAECTAETPIPKVPEGVCERRSAPIVPAPA